MGGYRPFQPILPEIRIPLATPPRLDDFLANPLPATSVEREVRIFEYRGRHTKLEGSDTECYLYEERP
jgi:hypothetical protein